MLCLQIDYTFHGSAYYTFSLLLMIWYFAYALLALGFHFGPLQFLFYDYIPRSKMTQSLFQKLATMCAKVSTRLELYVLQHLVCMPPPANARQEEVNTSGLVMMAEKSEPTAFCNAAQPLQPGFSRISLVFGRVVDVQISLWNRSLYHQWLPTLVNCGRSTTTRVKDLLDVMECRYMFVMQQDGLLLGFFMAVRFLPHLMLYYHVDHGDCADSYMAIRSLLKFAEANCVDDGEAPHWLRDAI